MEKVSRVVIREDFCKECLYCINFCPTKVLDRDMSKLNSRGYHPTKFINEDGCIMCGICGEVCPEGAIDVYRIKEEVKK
ncbi:MAG TPA: 4Fe-4S binding protein [Caldisericia bacterium]|nr:4Fe-4S binding protein [Caldisericia bacterium]